MQKMHISVIYIIVSAPLPPESEPAAKGGSAMGSTPIPRQHGLPVGVAMIRQHTPLNVVIHEEDAVISLQVIGDQSVVLLGLTVAGATTLITELQRAVIDLRRGPTIPAGSLMPRIE
jgi:hypothetical protein